jgi:hypothetical protein
VRGAVLALLASVTVLGMSGCGGGAKANPEVERDLSRVSRVFSGWATVPYPSGNCGDIAGGSPTAIATRALRYPPQAEDPWDTIYIAVEYRSPQNVRRDIAGFATTAELDCRAAEETTRRYSDNGRGLLPATVSFIPGVPDWLAHAVGPQLQGYRELWIPPFGWPRHYHLVFDYRDRRDPHVTYHVLIDATSPSGNTEDPTVNRALRRNALQVIAALS